jgi:uncharacterized protein (TIGR02001 family)
MSAPATGDRHANRHARRACIALIWLAAFALADEPAGAAGPWGGTVASTSDYVFRGVSQRHGAAAAQGDLHYRSTRGWFAGLWGTMADPPPGDVADLELNLYAGFESSVSDRWSATVSVVRYVYPDAPGGARYDYSEAFASIRFEDRLALTVAYSPEARRYSTRYGWGPRRRTVSYEASVRQPAVAPLALIAAIGYYDTSALFGESYWAWNAGLAATAGPVEFTLLRFGVDAAGRRLFGANAADGRWVVSAAWRF